MSKIKGVWISAINGYLYVAMDWCCCCRLGLSRLYKALYILTVHLFLLLSVPCYSIASLLVLQADPDPRFR